MNDADLSAYIAALKPTLTGRFFFYCLPFRRAVVINNMQRVFKERLTKAQIKRLALSFYSHIATSLKENVQMRFMSQEGIQAKAEVRGTEYIQAIADNNQGVIILTGHFGNWEFSPIAGILNFKAYQGRFHFIRKTIGSQWLENILFRRYYQAGLHVIPKKNSLNQVCDALENKDAVVFVMDQHACIGSKDGIAVEFFGEKAGTYRSLATIAQYTELPVVPAASYRLKNGKHVLEFFPALIWQHDDNRRQALYKNTLAYNQVLEKLILRKPEQWLWMHKRWKL